MTLAFKLDDLAALGEVDRLHGLGQRLARKAAQGAITHEKESEAWLKLLRNR